MKSLSAKELIKKGRISILFDEPFFATLLLRMDMKEDRSVEKVTTNGKVLKYNPDYIETLPLGQVKGALCRAVLHLALNHHTRRGSRDAKKWNKACDYPVTGIMEKSHIEYPPGSPTHPKYNDMSAEEVYQLLQSDPEDDGNQPGNGKGDGGGKKPPPNGPGNDDFEDPTGQDGKSKASQAEMRHQEEEWKIALSQAYETAKLAGKVPAGMDRMIQDILEPKLDWKFILRRFIEEAINNDYTWAKPNRRYITQNLYLPGVKKDEELTLCVFVDTSGSISPKDLDEAASEINAIASQFHLTSDVLYFDTEVANHEHFEPEDLPIQLHPKGGGGTRVSACFEYVEEKGISPRCVIVLTDMYTPFPEEIPEYPTLWVTANKDVKPPFGEVILT